MSVANGNVPENANGTVTEDVPAVIGINFGNTYASIAVITKTGLAECIANEDGERQIACAVSFHGEEIYIGNQAKHQLVKNAENTIVNFRNLLGKKYSEIPKDKPVTSAPVIQHPDQPDVPAYKVAILQPAPTPIPLPKSSSNTPAASQLATPRSEPIPAERILTVDQVTTIFLKSLLQSAQDFLGRPVHGAVISVPDFFDENARDALAAAAKEAGINVLQLLDEGAAGIVVTATSPLEGLHADRTTLVVDIGQTMLSLTVCAIRHGLVHKLASSHHETGTGEQLDERIVKFFAKEFTKKTKVPLTVCPSTDKADKRAESKLRLAIEHTKRTISASPSAASCSVESLKDGIDFNGSINRLRFDLEAKPVYDAIVKYATALVKSVNLHPLHVDEIVYVGGTASLPSLDEAFFGTEEFPETIVTPFTAGTVVGGGVGDPTTILARGCALQAKLIVSIPEHEADLKEAFKRDHEKSAVKAISQAIGLFFPHEPQEGDEPGSKAPGSKCIIGIPGETPLPYRRTVQFDADLGEGETGTEVAVEVWEVHEHVKEEEVKQAREKFDDEEDEDLDEEDEEEVTIVREKALDKTNALGYLKFRPQHSKKEKGRWKSTLLIELVATTDGKVTIVLFEEGGSKSDGASLTIPGQ